jgi:hypothetical protein
MIQNKQTYSEAGMSLPKLNIHAAKKLKEEVKNTNDITFDDQI